MSESPMDESLTQFESELSRLRPKPLARDLINRMGADLDRPATPSRADRCLLTFMGGGALAASVIVGLLTWQIIGNRAPTVTPQPSEVTVAQQQQQSPPPATIADYQVLLARSNTASSLDLLR